METVPVTYFPTEDEFMDMVSKYRGRIIHKHLIGEVECVSTLPQVEAGARTAAHEDLEGPKKKKNLKKKKKKKRSIPEDDVDVISMEKRLKSSEKQYKSMEKRYLTLEKHCTSLEKRHKKKVARSTKNPKIRIV